MINIEKGRAAVIPRINATASSLNTGFLIDPSRSLKEVRPGSKFLKRMKWSSKAV
jgi:hypothetical protein